MAFPGVAYAQGAASSGNNDDIIVTAQFREQRLQDTPIAITALSGEDIENKAQSSIADIASTAPNVNITQGASAFGGAAAYIRGIGQYDSNFALEPGVGMYVDDIYHGVMVGSMFDLLDLDRIEILRGPQGTLAGKNSIGGAVKLFSRKPMGDGSGYVSATYGSFDRIEVRGAYDLGITDNLAVRISAFTKRRDGHVDILDFACDRPGEVLPGDPPTQATGDDCRIGTLGGINSTGVRLALRFTPSDNVEINLFGSIIRDDSQAPGVEQMATIDSRYLPTRPYTYYGTFTSSAGWNSSPLGKTYSEAIGGQIDIDLSESIRLTSITGYENIDSEWVLDLDGSPLGDLLTYNRSPYHQFSQELRLSGEAGGGLLEWTVGGFYFDSLGSVAARVWSFPVLNWIQDDPVSNTSKSLFAHAVVNPTESLSIVGGIRYTDDKKTYTFSRLDPVTGDPAAIVGVLEGQSRSYSGDSTDFRLGVNYRFSDELMAYAQFSTGYKGGGINPRPFIPIQVVPFNPERVKAYEVGFKSDFADNKVRLNVSAFLNKYQDIILVDANGYPGDPVTDPNWFPLSAVPFNAGNADIKGLELETMLRPVDGLRIEGSVSYLDFEYKTLDPNALASGIGPNSAPPLTANWKWSASIAYDIPFQNGATLTPQIFADYTSSYYTDPANTPANKIDGRTILNANITYKSPDESWELVAGVTNLADKFYYTNAFDITAINGTASNVVARPREFYVTVRRNF